MAPKAKTGGKSSQGPGFTPTKKPFVAPMEAAVQRYAAAGGDLNEDPSKANARAKAAGVDTAQLNKDVRRSTEGMLGGAIAGVNAARQLDKVTATLKGAPGASAPKDSPKPRNRQEAARKAALTRKMKGG